MKRFDDFQNSNDIIVTIPSNIKWDDYQKELDDAVKNNYVLNYKVNSFPKRTKIGNKCYLVYNNNIVGWLPIIGFEEKEFTCQTTSREWIGKFIVRSPKLTLTNPIPMKGFRGFRYF